MALALAPLSDSISTKFFLAMINGAKASAIIYSIVQTAKLNNLSTYYYLNHLLTELPKLCAKSKKGNIDTASLDQLLP
ncbi:MAG: transposase domain-containing protein [Butyrivibrio sp.]|nr:transposase domain-containing protein [Butyrivibrio sp.]